MLKLSIQLKNNFTFTGFTLLVEQAVGKCGGSEFRTNMIKLTQTYKSLAGEESKKSKVIHV